MPLPRLPRHIAHLLRPGLLAPPRFPRNPLFFSTTARRFTSSLDSSSSNSSASSDDAGPDSALTNHRDSPVSVSCTVSPPSSLAFLKPTPVVLLTGPFGGNWCYRDTWQATLADQGYQSTSVELKMPDKPLPSGEDYMRHFVNSLKTSIQTDHSFYPPILIAHGLHALVAQKYVESHPVSALVLVSPFIPELIKERFQRLSYALDHDQDVPETEAVDPLPVQPDEHEASQEEEITTEADDGAEIEDDGDDDDDEDDGWMAYDFKTHADVAAHEGFRERYILPKKAVYKIDQIGKEHQETERKERQEKERIAQHERAKEAGTDDSSSSGPVKLGKDSLPVQEDSASLDVNGDSLPEQTVESEASIRSPLEKLPLNIYDSISETIFEPTFPILLVTCNGDEIVSTDDVKEHHDLAGLVDHIELDDLDDGGHLIMVSDNTEWEQGIQGITAWLDSNGM